MGRNAGFAACALVLATAGLPLSPAPLQASSDLFPRRLLGPPVEMAELPAFDARELETSQTARRQFAWNLALNLFAQASAPTEYPRPRWLSWVTASEYSRLFFPLWNSLSSSEKVARAPIASRLIDDAYLADWTELPSSPGWDEAAYLTWKNGTLADAESSLGASALSRNYFSPSLISSYFKNYASVVACTEGLRSKATNEVGCFAQAHPGNALAVKAIWRLESLGVPVFDTATPALHRAFASPEDPWIPTGVRSGPADGALRVRRGDRVYALVGLHIMSKVLQDWFWATLWWSPEPDRDFGQDRPTAWRRRFPRWSGYKLCAVSGFSDGASNDIAAAYPELRSAIAEVAHHFPAEQWCSNPYIEQGHRNAATNCIGCHQFAGTSLNLGSEGVLALADYGRRKRAFLSPADYAWTLTHDPARLGIQTADRVGAGLYTRMGE